MNSALWATLTIEELLRLGVAEFYISPGSRSTPLVLAIHSASQRDTARCSYRVHFDERAAAFAALGHVRATERPVALVCTSGSALANYLPAVVEAAQQALPLLVVSADRPAELLNCGANQAIEQRGIYGSYVCAELDIAAAENSSDPKALLGSIDELFYRMLDARRPAHINCHYREPFTSDLDYDELLGGVALGRWSASREPLQPRPERVAHVEEADAVALGERLRDRSLLIIAGRLASLDEARAVADCAAELGAPLCGDITSQLRFCEGVIAHVDALVEMDLPTPEIVLHFGGAFVSKKLLAYTAALGVEYIHIDSSELPYNPAGQVSATYRGPVGFCRHLSGSASADLCAAWQRADELARRRLQEWVTANPFSEIALAAELCAAVGSDETLVLGASMPVRLANLVAAARDEGALISVAANRGASGIDGNIASAVGWAAGWGRPTTLLIGDLTLLHDATSLSLVAQSETPLRIVVINNGGGGIFHHLPIAHERRAGFEELFFTPHGHDSFAALAAQFKLAYAQPRSAEEFRAALDQRGSILIELNFDAACEARRFSDCMNKMIHG